MLVPVAKAIKRLMNSENNRFIIRRLFVVWQSLFFSSYQLKDELSARIVGPLAVLCCSVRYHPMIMTSGGVAWGTPSNNHLMPLQQPSN